MKNIICLMLLAFLTGCMTVRTYTLQEPVLAIYEDLSGTSDQIFIKANAWMVKTFNDAESVIQFSDKAEGTIIGKYLMGGSLTSSQYGSTDTRIYAIIDIRVKDGKARISIDPGTWTSYDPSLYPKYALTEEWVIERSEELADEFHSYLIKSEIDF